MNVNLHHLQLFYYVAKARGISSAVKIIPYGIQQPAISQQLIQLEEDLGVKLFRRRPFELSPAGDKLYRSLARFFDNLESDLLALKDDAGVRIRFGCPSVISSNYLPELIRRMIEKFPVVRPYISELDGYDGATALINREIDIAISFVDLIRSKAVTAKKLMSVPMAMIVPENHRFVKEGFWPKSDFAREKWISVQARNEELEEGLSQYGLTPEYVASTTSIAAALKYVEMGIGIALMAQPTPDLLADHKVVCLPQPDIFGAISLTIAWRKDSLIDEKILKFIYQTAKALCEQITHSVEK